VARRQSRLDNRPEFRVWNWRSPGWAGDLKGVQERWPPNPVPGSRAAQQAGGDQAQPGRRSFFQQAAPGAACLVCAGSQRKSLRTGQHAAPMSGLPERLAAWPAGKSLPMTINDRGRNPAQAGRTLHAPAEARRAFRDLARAEAAKLPECWPGQQDVGRVP